MSLKNAAADPMMSPKKTKLKYTGPQIESWMLDIPPFKGNAKEQQEIGDHRDYGVDKISDGEIVFPKIWNLVAKRDLYYNLRCEVDKFGIISDERRQKMQSIYVEEEKEDQEQEQEEVDQNPNQEVDQNPNKEVDQYPIQEVDQNPNKEVDQNPKKEVDQYPNKEVDRKQKEISIPEEQNDQPRRIIRGYKKKPTENEYRPKLSPGGLFLGSIIVKDLIPNRVRGPVTECDDSIEEEEEEEATTMPPMSLMPEHLKWVAPICVSTLIPSRQAPKLKRKDVLRVIQGPW
ncbi:hypothetical protein KR084_009370 [Drosophila pseudotakahashii]|nr:hypothetical protein KR084_009370 [Drosophila pseudotakahashii]